MKNTRAIVMILLSLLAGAVAVILAARWVGQQAAENTTLVVVAKRDLDLGAPLTSAMMQEIPWPTSAVPAGFYKEVKVLEGRVTRSPVFKGEPILEPKLAPAGTKGGLPSIIGEGKRAISVKVNEVMGVAGFALPGSFVDVMVNVMDNRDKSISKIVLERIMVLAVAQEANRDDTKPKVVNAVTLEVTPEQAEKIDLARSIGSLSLVLRNPIDQKVSDTAGVHRDDLLGKASAPEAPAVAPQPVVAAATVAPAPAAPKAKSVRSAAPRAAPASATAVEVIRGVQKANSEF
jgi:pilus assembly protein CpaB